MAPTANGTWYPGLDNGASWNPPGGVSKTVPLPGAGMRVAFAPHAGYSGTTPCAELRRGTVRRANGANSTDTTRAFSRPPTRHGRLGPRPTARQRLLAVDLREHGGGRQPVDTRHRRTGGVDALGIECPAAAGNGAALSTTATPPSPPPTGMGHDPGRTTAREPGLVVSAVNTPRADRTVLEDGSYTFTTADFGFSDPSDSPANALLAVKIGALPGAGALRLDGAAVSAGDFVSAADIAAGKLRFAPPPTPTARATRASASRCGTTAASPMAASISTHAEHDHHRRHVGQRRPGWRQQDRHRARGRQLHLHHRRLRLLRPQRQPGQRPAGGEDRRPARRRHAETRRRRGERRRLRQRRRHRRRQTALRPAANANGAGYASFSFQVRDNGGTADGGIDLDPRRTPSPSTSPRVNDAPRSQSTPHHRRRLTVTLDNTMLHATDVESGPAALSYSVSGLGGGFFAHRPHGGDLELHPGTGRCRQRDLHPRRQRGRAVLYAHRHRQQRHALGTVRGDDQLCALNDAPMGTSRTISLLEDGRHLRRRRFRFQRSRRQPVERLARDQDFELAERGKPQARRPQYRGGRVRRHRRAHPGQAQLRPRPTQWQRLRELRLSGPRRWRGGQWRCRSRPDDTDDQFRCRRGQRCTHPERPGQADRALRRRLPGRWC